MNRRHRSALWLAILNLLLFAGMITANALANTLPINNLTTGELSAFYPNLFVPAGLTFSIWAVIYALLFIYVIYGLVISAKGLSENILNTRTQLAFALTCLLNAAWILFWHYKLIFWSELVMLALLGSLIYLFLQTEKLKIKDQRIRVYVVIPVSVYLGWITVATIANTTALLVAKDWGAWGLPENMWAVILILTGTAITAQMLFKYKNIAYALVVIWAYTGIIIKRAQADILFRDIIFISSLSIGVLLVLIIYTIIKNLRKAEK